ncbi:unnamed protein product, partial [Rhizoctonia solani]
MLTRPLRLGTLVPVVPGFSWAIERAPKHGDRSRNRPRWEARRQYRFYYINRVADYSLGDGPFGTLESAFKSPRPWLSNEPLRTANSPAVTEQTTTSIRGEYLEFTQSVYYNVLYIHAMNIL